MTGLRTILLFSVIWGDVLYISGCRSTNRNNALDHREEQENPVTTDDLLQAEIFACEANGKNWLPERRLCVVPAVFCNTRSDHFFDNEKDICLSPRDLCLAEDDGSEWIDDTCISAQEACANRGHVWTGKTCARTKQACLTQSEHWIWLTEENRCRPKTFLEYCQDEEAPASARATVEAIRRINGGGEEQTCSEAWQYAYYQPLLRLSTTTDLPLTDLYPLIGLAQLQGVEIIGQPIEDLLPLSHLPSLTKLTITKSKVLVDLSGLEQAKNLKTLNLSDNKISIIKPIGKLTELTSLTLSGNNIVNLEALHHLNKLEELNLAQNPITTAFYLRNLESLKTIDLSKTPLDDSIPKTPTNCPRGTEVSVALDRFCAEIHY